MNSDHVQRYHIRQDGLITNVPSGEWVKYEDVELMETFNTLHTHQEILHELKNLQTEHLEKCSLSFYGRGFLHGIDECINLVTESMEENI